MRHHQNKYGIYSKKQRKSSRFMSRIRQGGFQATQRTYDVSEVAAGSQGLLAALALRLLGRRKKV